MLANHRDVQTSPLLPIGQVSASGFHCHIDDLVVVAPFLPDIQMRVSGITSSAPLFFSEPVNTCLPASLNSYEGRGPPALFCV